MTAPARTRTRTAFAPSPRQARETWVRFIAAARLVGGGRGAAAPPPGFAHELHRTARAAFPLPYASAKHAAAAFLDAARGYAEAGRDADRAALAEFVAAGAACLDRMLTADNAARAEAWQRRMPGD